MNGMTRWRGLSALIQDAVEHGARAVERVHMESTGRPFAAIERIPPIASAARAVHLVHDAAVTAAYGAVRLVARLVGATVDAALDLAEPPDRAGAGRA